VDVEAAAGVVGYGGGEGGVGCGVCGCGWVYVGFCVGAGGGSLAGFGVRVGYVGNFV
jgi:hypothetical protein